MKRKPPEPDKFCNKCKRWADSHPVNLPCSDWGFDNGRQQLDQILSAHLSS